MWTYHIPKLLHWDVAAEGHCSELIAMLKKQYWADWALWHDALFGSMYCGDTGMDTVATILSTNWTLFKQDTHIVTSPQAWTDILTLPSKHYSKGGNFTVSHSNLVNVAYQLVTQTAATHWLFISGPVSAILQMPGWDEPQQISSLWNTKKHGLTPCYMLHATFKVTEVSVWCHSDPQFKLQAVVLTMSTCPNALYGRLITCLCWEAIEQCT